MSKNNSNEKSQNANIEKYKIFPNYENCTYVTFVPEGKNEEEAITFTQVNQRLKELRKQNGLTQTEIAKVLNISQREYWRYEQEGYNVSITRLGILAMFYNVSIDWISGFHQEKKPFFADHQNTSINGYCLDDFKKK